MIKEKKGITLIALTITIIVLIILASITTYSGVSTIQSSKLNKYKQELEIMQSQVQLLYEKYKDKESIDIGKEINGSGKEEIARQAFWGAGETETSGYRIFDKEEIEKLGIDGIEREYLLDIMNRKVICLEPFEQDGNLYYTLEQIPGTDKNTIDEGIIRDDVKFDIATEEVSEGYKITLSNIEFSKYVGKGKVQYSVDGGNKWKTVEDNLRTNSYSFIVNETGTYLVKITDAADKIGERELTIENVEKNWYLELQWENTGIDGTLLDVASTSDGGCVAVGYSEKAISGIANKGGKDALIAKFSSSGNLEWANTIGGSRDDIFNAVAVKPDGSGYVAVGNLYSVDVDGLVFKSYRDDIIPPSEGLIVEYSTNGNESSKMISGETYNDSLVGEEVIGTGWEPAERLLDFRNIYFNDMLILDDGSIIIVGKAIMSRSYDSIKGFGIIFENVSGNWTAQYVTDSLDGSSYAGNAYYYSYPIDIEKYSAEPFMSIGIFTGISKKDDLIFMSGSWYNRICDKYDKNTKNVTNMIDGPSFGASEEILVLNENEIIISNVNRFYKWNFETSYWEDSLANAYKTSEWYVEEYAISLMEHNQAELAVLMSSKLGLYNLSDGSLIREYSIPTYNKAISPSENNFIMVGDGTIAYYKQVYK